MEENKNTPYIPQTPEAQAALDNQPAAVIDAVAKATVSTADQSQIQSRETKLTETPTGVEMNLGEESIHVDKVPDTQFDSISEEDRKKLFPRTEGVEEPLPRPFPSKKHVGFLGRLLGRRAKN